MGYGLPVRWAYCLSGVVRASSDAGSASHAVVAVAPPPFIIECALVSVTPERAETEPVTVELVLTKDEAVPFYRWLVSRRFRVRRGVLAMIPIIVIGAASLLIPGLPKVFGVILVGLGILQLLYFGWIVFIAPVRAWNRNPPEKRRMVFSDSEVRVYLPKTNAVQLWSVYSETLEHDDLYLLKVGTRNAYVAVPKRAFESTDDEERFRQLAGRHTSATLRRVTKR